MPLCKPDESNLSKPPCGTSQEKAYLVKLMFCNEKPQNAVGAGVSGPHILSKITSQSLAKARKKSRAKARDGKYTSFITHPKLSQDHLSLHASLP